MRMGTNTMTESAWQQRLLASTELSQREKQDELAKLKAKEQRIHDGLSAMAHSKFVVFDDLIKALKNCKVAKGPDSLNRVEMYLEAQIRNIRRMQVTKDFTQETKAWYITTLQEIQFDLPYIKFRNGVINDYVPQISKDILALKKKTKQMGIEWEEVQKHIVDQENRMDQGNLEATDFSAPEIIDQDKLKEYDKYITQNYRALTPDEQYLAKQRNNYQINDGIINFSVYNLEKTAGIDADKICDLAKAKFDATNLNVSELYNFVRATVTNKSANPENIDAHALHNLVVASMDKIIQKGIERQRMNVAMEYGRTA